MEFIIKEEFLKSVKHAIRTLEKLDDHISAQGAGPDGENFLNIKATSDIKQASRFLTELGSYSIKMD